MQEETVVSSKAIEKREVSDEVGTGSNADLGRRKQRGSSRDRSSRDRGSRRKRSESRSRSRSRSRSGERNRSYRDRDRFHDRDYMNRDRDRDRGRDRDRDRFRDGRDRGYGYGSRGGDGDSAGAYGRRPAELSLASAAVTEEAREELRKQREIDDLTKDQRTIFVSQLTKKVTERNLENFFGQVGKVKNIIMLRDKVSGAHKGFAYVEMADLESIPNTLLFNNVVPDFQKFAILVKASEAEKNFLAKKEASNNSSSNSGGDSAGAGSVGGSGDASMAGDSRVYVGNIHTSVDEAAVRPLLEQFGAVDSIKLHRDHLGNSKGFAFVKFARMESAALCMMSLGGVELAGRQLKVGPVIDQNQKAVALMAAAQGGGIGAMQQSIAAAATGALQTGGYDAAGNWKLDADDGQGQGLGLTSSSRAMLMAKLGQSAGLNVPMPVTAMAIPAASAAPTVAAAIPAVSGDPSVYLMVANMFDLAAETGDDWELEIKEDVMDECAKHGSVLHVHVETKKPGGIVLLKFASTDGAVKTANSLNGRFFAKRMITCAFLQEAVYKELLE